MTVFAPAFKRVKVTAYIMKQMKSGSKAGKMNGPHEELWDAESLKIDAILKNLTDPSPSLFGNYGDSRYKTDGFYF